MQRTKIYYIEDEPSLGRIVSDTLEKLGYEVYWERDGGGVMSYFEKNTPDVCVLDIMLPNIDGLSLCKTIRGMYPRLPVIFLTAKTDTSDLLSGFESGGTDYIKKPFRIEELIARIENQLCLAKGSAVQNNFSREVHIGAFTLDPLTYILRSDKAAIQLSGRDMQVLKILYANRNGMTSRKDLLLCVWGDDSYFNSRNLDVYIRKLRGYLSADPSVKIITVKGNGYLFIIPTGQ